MCESLCECWRVLLSFIKSDLFANIISVLELTVAVIAIIIGDEKVNKFLEEYRRKRIEATFGFYVNLGFYIKRIRPLIEDDSGKPMKTLYLLSALPEKRASGYKALGDKLSLVAYECLQYLSTGANQIPPSDDESDRNTWKDSIDSFVNYLNQFYLIKDFPICRTIVNRQECC